jgi:hypothetical protein
MLTSRTIQNFDLIQDLGKQFRLVKILRKCFFRA